MKLAQLFSICIACICSLLFISSASAQTDLEEVDRIQQHLADVEEYLRATDVSDWPVALQRERIERLDDLREYRLAGVFPRNIDFEDARVPYFIDDRGVACAVAHLMIESGHEDAANAISRRENNAWLMEMTSPEVAEWIPTSGLTAEEAAWIQPTYGFCDDVFAEISGPTTAGCAEKIELVASEVPAQECSANYHWQLISGEPAPTLEGEIGQTLTVTLPKLSGTVDYVFELVVSNQGHQASAQHTVTATCGDASTNNNTGGTNSEPDPEPKDPTDDHACTTGLGGQFPLLGLLLFGTLAFTRRKSSI